MAAKESPKESEQKREQEQVQAPTCALEVAASHRDPTHAELDDVIDGAQEEQLQLPDLNLRPGQNKPTITFSSVGHGRSNPAVLQLTGTAAKDHGLASPYFEALYARFNDAAQAITAKPVFQYDKNNRHQYPVTWSPDGKEMRCNMQALLTAKHWCPPPGKVRHVPVVMRRHHVTQGTCLIFRLHDSLLEDTKAEKAKKAREREQRAQSSEAP